MAPALTTKLFSRTNRHIALAAIVVSWLVFATPASATWSIIIIDTETKEIAVGSATCLTDFDLQAELPVVITDVGAGCAQALVDFTGDNRLIIHFGLLGGTRPNDIIALIRKEDSSFQHRQFGIAATTGFMDTFTGSETSDFANGLTGTSGSLIYTIQGNILTGSAVITAAETAIRSTSGPLPEKLMAAMEAAREMGGDGRCSCRPDFPQTCGAPPPSFDKAAHIGFMIVTRSGDTNGVCDNVVGCANGDYYMDFNVARQQQDDPDPVFQLRDSFDTWRAELTGRPDAIESTAQLGKTSILADGLDRTNMTITLRDWQSTTLTSDTLTVAVEHAADSDATTTILPVVPVGNGVFHVELSETDVAGLDRFVVTVDDGIRPVVILPHPTLSSIALSDFDREGDVDLHDYSTFHACLGGPAAEIVKECVVVDVTASGHVDLNDFRQFQLDYTAAACAELYVLEHPADVTVLCGDPFSLFVMADADPAPKYQWYLNHVAIPGATHPEYSVPFTRQSDLGLYNVEVTNTCGKVRSHFAIVDTYRPPCP